MRISKETLKKSKVCVENWVQDGPVALFEKGQVWAEEQGQYWQERVVEELEDIRPRVEKPLKNLRNEILGRLQLATAADVQKLSRKLNRLEKQVKARR